jgi:hypothetical protein
MDQKRNIGGEDSDQGAFAAFRAKIRLLSERQNGVFTDIMQRINERKIAQARQKINGLQDNDDQK